MFKIGDVVVHKHYMCEWDGQIGVVVRLNGRNNYMVSWMFLNHASLYFSVEELELLENTKWPECDNKTIEKDGSAVPVTA